jgi:benzoyl-CoA reductase/2-hydroxyglutaryl-CoA dehydratase subunit BcrC/BadD/HgdB
MFKTIEQNPNVLMSLKQDAEKARAEVASLEQKEDLSELEKAFTLPMAKHTEQHRERLYQAALGQEPLVATYYPCGPEIMAAMDLSNYCLLATALMFGGSGEDIDKCEEMGLGTDVCTAIRLGIHSVEHEISPIPHAMIALLHPCDGTLMMHQVIQTNEKWRDVPIFGADPPYMESERSVEYYAQELRRMVHFLEEHTGKKLDMDRLREVVEENNVQYELWMEHNELKRAIPCPHAGSLGAQMFGIAQGGSLCGNPLGTTIMRKTIADAERRVREGVGVIEKERIRLLWFDIRPVGLEIAPWLEEEWGAVIVMDMFGYCPYTLIDTSSEETMFKGMAKRYLYDSPMIRQARGIADNFAGDIRRIVKEFSIDCVIWPGHMGHKDSAASVGIMREVCREIEVPFLHIGMDLFDERYTTLDALKNKVSTFFSGMGLG